MGRTACTEPQCLYKGALYFTLLYFTYICVIVAFIYLFIYNLGSPVIQCRRMGLLVHMEFERLWKEDAVA